MCEDFNKKYELKYDILLLLVLITYLIICIFMLVVVILNGSDVTMGISFIIIIFIFEFDLIVLLSRDQEEEIKTIIKEDQIHKKDALETEVVKVKLLAKSDKAYQAIFNNIENWIPKSTIHNDFNYVQDQEATLIVETWVLKKNFKGGEN